MFNYEKLEVWHEAIAFADTIYTITKAFPDDERFGLTNQMRRAAVSISLSVLAIARHTISAPSSADGIPSRYSSRAMLITANGKGAATVLGGCGHGAAA